MDFSSDFIIKSELIKVFSNIKELNFNLSINQLKRKVYDYYYAHTVEFLGLFSNDTIEVITSILVDGMKDVKIQNEDGELLYKSLIIDSENNIDENFRNLLLKLIGETSNIIEKVTNNTLIKGLIDLYGCISFNDLYRIFKDYRPLINFEDFKKIIDDSRLINYYCEVNETHIYRKEASENLKEIMFFQKSLHDRYKIFSIENVIYFANRFHFRGVKTPYEYERTSASAELFPEFVEGENPSKEKYAPLLIFNSTQPKWHFCGYSFNEIIKKIDDADDAIKFKLNKKEDEDKNGGNVA